METNRSSARCFPTLKQARRRATIPPSLPLRPKTRSANVSTVSTATPCPAGLDIALINKYYDLAKLGDGLAKEHYLTLEKNAQDCVSCGHCDSRCPFRVHQSERMQEILAYFGK